MIFSRLSFHAYYWAQFLGAFADNLFKTALIALFTFRGVQVLGLSGEPLAALAGGVFILPFFLASGFSGVLADRISKSTLIRQVKLLEVFIMLLAAACFVKGWESMLLLMLFLMGFQSALFGPVKYSVIPDLVGQEHILSANSAVELGTFLSILLGTLAGGYFSQSHIPAGILALFLIIPSVTGWLWTFLLPPLPAPSAQPPLTRRDWASSNWRVVQLAWRTPGVRHILPRISWFWFVGAGLMVLLPGLTVNNLRAQESVFVFLLTLFCSGIAFGALFTWALARRKGLLLAIQVGAWGMALGLAGMAAALASWQVVPITPFALSELMTHFWPRVFFVSLFSLAFFASSFVVPFYTLLVGHTPKPIRSQIIGANNVLNSLFMVLSSGAIMVAFSLSLESSHLLAGYAILQLFTLQGLARLKSAYLESASPARQAV